MSFTQAAHVLNVTQGAVSRQIKQLEDYLGVPLFIRLHHRLELTDAGRQLLTKLEQSFNLMEGAVQELRDPNQRQKLNILVPLLTPPAGLPPPERFPSPFPGTGTVGTGSG
ncbi:LysR family transcriptional regulator [Aliamphritea spongicola]